MRGGKHCREYVFRGGEATEQETTQKSGEMGKGTHSPVRNTLN